LIARLDCLDDIEVVGEGQDGSEALALCAETRPDIVLMDITMPVLSGIDATRLVKREHENTKVIVLSMHSEKRFVSEALRAGVSGYVLKGDAFDELAGAIQTVASGGVYLSPNVQKAIVSDYVNAAGSPVKSRAELTPREREVLQLIAEGMTAKQVASHLFLNVKTVETHRRQVMDKIGVDSVAGLVRYALREGITTLDG
jgi:DNA-binding NarL/FixJ family response regulator